MILVAATIEHDRGNASVLSLLGDQFADLLGGFGLGALETGEIRWSRVDSLTRVTPLVSSMIWATM